MTVERYAPQLYGVLRVVFGFLFLCHGLQKVFGLFGHSGVPLASMLGVAGLIEIVVGPLLIVGWLTRAAAFVASGEMAVAYFTHQTAGGWPIENNGELAVLYCFAFLYMVARGAGPYSVDARFAPMKWRFDRGSMAATR